MFITDNKLLEYLRSKKQKEIILNDKDLAELLNDVENELIAYYKSGYIKVNHLFNILNKIIPIIPNESFNNMLSHEYDSSSIFSYLYIPTIILDLFHIIRTDRDMILLVYATVLMISITYMKSDPNRILTLFKDLINI